MLTHKIALLSTLVSSVISDQEPFRVDSAKGDDCCKTLKEALPDLVHFPDSPEYQSRLESYYALQQRDLQAACRLMPHSASEVSLILGIARKRDCPFAVVSGGYMPWVGASNIDGGFVIDLGKINQIDVVEDDKSLKLGPGSTWKQAYSVLEPYNLTTVGARVANVGVGGFLMGGGISFLSFEHGFGSDNVLNYEVVLSNGSIIEVNESSHPELHWALKAGSTNFGIVTRFDMPTFPLSRMWASQQTYLISEEGIGSTPELLYNRIYYLKSHNNDNKDVIATILGETKNIGLATVVRAYLGPKKRKPLTSAMPIMDKSEIGSLYNVVDQLLGDSFYPKRRSAWYTLTVKADTDFFYDMYLQGQSVFSGFYGVDGLQWAILLQPITRGLIAATSRSPFQNALKASNDVLFLVPIVSTWTNSRHDEVIEEATNKLGAWAEKEAARRGLLNDFIYLNYANKNQPVYERSMTREDIARMRRTKEMYDSTGIFDKLWRGGFKLPKQEMESKVAHDRTEL
ncbi:fad binding domain-containing protein [Moniliophthora roreri MCA 2997]|uniref:Fad binding domain-containing protein n=1 Tax=Moniliophthora roreri (strain MCA 2997) TaxID=1381753 RepID=V2X269_MONRO|nr:fad binding domain-containing protein [Moniliophthora roreri MCA 2997]